MDPVVSASHLQFIVIMVGLGSGLKKEEKKHCHHGHHGHHGHCLDGGWKLIKIYQLLLQSLCTFEWKDHPGKGEFQIKNFEIKHRTV